MSKVQILFVYPHNIVGAIVDIAEGFGEDPSHVAVLRPNGKMLEAVAPCVTDANDVSIYDHCKTKVITVEVPDIDSAEAMADTLLGRRYGLWTSCVSGGIHDIFNVDAVIGDDSTIDCSETAVLYLRAGRYNVLPDHPAKCVTPGGLLEALQ